MDNVEELERALEYPWEKWAIFLHPTQKELVERDYNGPARIPVSHLLPYPHLIVPSAYYFQIKF